MAGGSFGSVLGVALGGVLAVHFGWRWSFAVMAILGLVLVALYRLLVNDAQARPRTGARRRRRRASRVRPTGRAPSCARCSPPRR